MTMEPTLLDRARAWQSEDPDPRMRAALGALIDAAARGDESARQDLADSFNGTLEFGTSGLRGPVGPGPNRMNAVVVARAAAGLAAYLQARGGGSVVVGHDARHGSAEFARMTAQILTGAGLEVLMLPPQSPTPLLAFSIRRLGCAAGVMVTASHNPRQDNGYKVYLDDGIQIVPPADTQISACIAEATARGSIDQLPRGTDGIQLDDTIVEDYVRTTTALLESSGPLNVKVAYTPVHGVGGPLFQRVLASAGVSNPFVVESQFSPDPDFGGMPFPNPEEPGVMDAVLALAREHACDVAIANDPDADRCAVGVPTPDGWRMLSGDEVGWLLGWWITAGNRRSSSRSTLAQSIVSGSMLKAIADDAAVPYVQTLTGFKWIGRVPNLAFGYEEALGYCVHPTAVADKDGISAGLMFTEMVGRLAERGSTVLGILDELALRHGAYATGQVSVRQADPARIVALMTSIRDHPPSTIGGSAVLQIDDLERPTDGLPPTDGLRFRLADDGRVIVRPSGTEAKIKSYLQVRVPVTAGDLISARSSAAARIAALKVDLAVLLA
jgi:phosphomannomutase